MKKYFMGFCVIVPGLILAAAEPIKKMDCRKLAQFVSKEMAGRHPRVRPDSLSVATGRRGFGRMIGFSCNNSSLDSEELFDLQGAKQTAEMAEDDLAALECCVGQSPEYAADPAVEVARDILKGLSLARWHQCSGAHDAAAQERKERLEQERTARAQQEEEEKEMRAYVAQVGKKRT